MAAAHAQLGRGTPLRLTTPERVGTATAMVLLGVAAGALGAYGWRHGEALLPRALAPEQVPHRVAVLRRGCVACIAAGLVLLAAAVVVVLA